MARRERDHPSGPTAAQARGRSDGFGRPSSAAAERVSDDLRRGTGTYLRGHGRFCSWCLLATAATVAMIPQVVPEARAAIAALVDRRAA